MENILINGNKVQVVCSTLNVLKEICDLFEITLDEKLLISKEVLAKEGFDLFDEIFEKEQKYLVDYKDKYNEEILDIFLELKNLGTEITSLTFIYE